MDYVERVASHLNLELSEGMRQCLGRLEAWLASEAIAAGGIGPNEPPRLNDRHLADSLLFAVGWRGPEPPQRWLDLGSGVGLPGLVLATVWPDTEGILLDRSGRRVDLARRACRVVGLDNVTVVEADASRADFSGIPLVVSRAVASAEQIVAWSRPWLMPGGVVIVGGSHHERPPAGPGELLEIPPTVLDRPVWIRIMAPE